MTVLLPEARYKKHKSDLTVLINFCCLVAILGDFFSQPLREWENWFYSVSVYQFATKTWYS